MVRTLTSLLSFFLIFSLTASPVLAATDGFDKGPSAKELREKYEDKEVRILIAVGHEPDYGGAIYQGVYEREIVVEIASELEALLKQNPKYDVVVTRSNTSWDKKLDRYFKKEASDIEKFVKKQKKEMAKLVRKGKIEEELDAGSVPHAAAREDVALRLYGINRWANENDVDLVVNLHVNDAPDHGPTTPSKHTGHAVYIPDSIYGNHKTSKELALAVVEHLEELSEVSTFPGEDQGVVPDRELIAVGAFGTLNVPSVLVEYGYITEPRFILPEHRETVTKDTAYQTYLALQDFFNDPVANPRTVKKLPTKWPEPAPVATSTIAALQAQLELLMAQLPSTASAASTPVEAAPGADAPVSCTPFTEPLSLDLETETEREDVRRLQRMLAKDPTVYPEGLVTGFFGPLTEAAVKRFQEKHSIVASGTPKTTGYGLVGPQTSEALALACAV